ncbi:SDR family NAD(P)-dependent oxidoreductase [Gleimia hominis]|uniref:SDR family NAD(P)-dependent oxidoreductase n=1 Tax=Gleimia hominis TaxID=595468 RepID=UPI000C804CE5|nr:SDR family oxidoreductase [Gleimia hominis]WIK64468.1 SDR family oxidoreductase [Gleimia hominis]
MGTALITGASSGLGEEFAWQLATAKHNVVLVARRREKLEQLANKLEQACGVRAEVIVADLCAKQDRQKVQHRLRTSRYPVGLLVNNAGFGLGSSFLENSLEDENYGLDVMVRAVMELCHTAAREMVGRGRGAILNVSSVASETGMGTYSAHKAWVRSFSEGLAEELKGTNVTCTAVVPGMVRTHFHDNFVLDTSQVPPVVWVSAETVVSESLRAVSRGKTWVVPSLKYKVTDTLSRVSPRRMVRYVTRHLPHV